MEACVLHAFFFEVNELLSLKSTVFLDFLH